MDFAKRIGEGLVDARWDRITHAIDTRGEGIPIIAFNTLGWARTDVAEVTLGFTAAGVTGIMITDAAGAAVPVQILSAVRGRDQGIREARVAFTARDVPAIGYCTYHATPVTGTPAAAAPELLGKVDDGSAAEAVLEDDQYRIAIDRFTGAITRLQLKSDN